METREEMRARISRATDASVALRRPEVAEWPFPTAKTHEGGKA